MPFALSNCNLANVCQYGGEPKGDGTQGCSCFTAPDCSSTEKCPLGLGGEAKSDGTQTCICTEGVKATFHVGTYKYTSKGKTWYGFTDDSDYKVYSQGSLNPQKFNGWTIHQFRDYYNMSYTLIKIYPKPSSVSVFLDGKWHYLGYSRKNGWWEAKPYLHLSQHVRKDIEVIFDIR